MTTTSRKSMTPRISADLDSMSIADLVRARRGSSLSSDERAYALCMIASMRAELRGDIDSAEYHRSLAKNISANA